MCDDVGVITKTNEILVRQSVIISLEDCPLFYGTKPRTVHWRGARTLATLVKVMIWKNNS